MNTEQLAKIRARADAATPGPWEVDARGEMSCKPNSVGYEYGYDILYLLEPHKSGMLAKFDDADFIAHAREDIPALLDAVAERDSKIKYLNAECRKLQRDALYWRDVSNSLEPGPAGIVRLHAEIDALRAAILSVTDAAPVPVQLRDINEDRYYCPFCNEDGRFPMMAEIPHADDCVWATLHREVTE